MYMVRKKCNMSALSQVALRHLARVQVQNELPLVGMLAVAALRFTFSCFNRGLNRGLLRKGSAPVYALWHVCLSHEAGEHILHALKASRLLKLVCWMSPYQKHYYLTIHPSQGCKTFSSHSTQSTRASICRARTH